MDNKFAHLLQPIRDLAGNWDVNVAEELEEYLEELESIHFDLEEESSPSLNFAEAALVIQGSTSVYSKKVEYLHSLVYAALEAIAEKRAQKVTRGEDDGNDASDADTEEQFLTLDDIAEGGCEIDIQDDLVREAPATIRAPTSLLILGHCEGPMSLSRTQTYTDPSGAVLIDPADSMISSNTFVRDQDAILAQQANHEASLPLSNDAFDPVDSTPIPAYDERIHDANEGGWDDDNEVGSITSDESEDEDPYRPLQWDQPGNLTIQPFKYKKPLKRLKPKKEQGFYYGELTAVVSLDTVALPEFKQYLKQIAKTSKDVAPATGQQDQDEGDHIEDYNEDGGHNDGGGVYSDDDGGQMSSFSPINDNMLFDSDAQIGNLEYDKVPGDDAHMTRQNLNPGGQTELNARVAQWQTRIQPLLDEQNQSAAFDIGAYGRKILGVMSSKVAPLEWTSFGTVASQEKQTEVTRLFASMLQLVNAGSLQIVKS